MDIYLDNAATTKVYEEVANEVSKIFLENYANPSSQHKIGQDAKKILEKSRKIIANYLGSNPKEIIFTSCATESNNLAIRGLAKASPEKKHIITSQIEHPSIMETCKDLEDEGYTVDYIEVNNKGVVNQEKIKEKIKPETLVVSIMHVNNEIGTIQPIEEIGKICKERGVYFHVDAVQSFTKIKIPLENIDLISVSGHKIGAPKGIGFLYAKKETKLKPIITGGGQESNIRSGTENLSSIVGLAKAIEIDNKREEIKKSRDKIMEGIKSIPGTIINGDEKNRVYHNINVSFYGIEGESLMLMLSKDKIYCSTGSACASSKLSTSHVLKAIGLDELYINGSLRLTLGPDAIGKEKYIIEKIKENVKKLQEMSPFKLNSGGKNGI